MNVPYYSDSANQFTIKADMINSLFSTDYSWYGLDNIYNAMHLIKDSQNTTDTAYLNATAVQFDLSAEQLKLFITQMRWHVTEFLMGGPNKSYKAKDLIQGYTTEINKRVNTGSLLLGNLYVDNVVTPILNTWTGPTSGQNFTVMTGQEAIDGVGVVRNANNQVYLYLNQSMYNGTMFTSVPWYNENLGSLMQLYDPTNPEYSLYGYKMPTQNTPTMSPYTAAKGIDTSSQSPYSLTYSSSETYCGNADDAVCTQHFPMTTYWNKNTQTMSVKRDQAPFNMPYTVMTDKSDDTQNSWTEMVVD